MDEAMAIVSDIESLLAQLKQLSGGDTPVEMSDDEVKKPEMDDEVMKKIMKFLKAEEEGETEEKKVEMSDDEDEDDLKKSVESPDATDKAEERIDDQGDVNEENINDVAKAVARLLGKRSVKKSKPVDPMTKIVKALEMISGRIVEQDKAIGNILTGLNITDTIMKSAEAKKVESRPAVNETEVRKTLDFIRTELGIERPETKSGDVFSLRKALTENDGMALKAMLSTKQK